MVLANENDNQAPFTLASSEGITILNQEEFSVQGLTTFIQKEKPSALYISGWMNNKYLKAVKGLKKQIPVICGMDNHWQGTIRQKIACILSPFILHNKFSHIWIPGLYQYPFALNLGFKKENILTGLYSADTNSILNAFDKIERKQHPKKFLFVGRLVPEKGVHILLDAFKQLKEEKSLNGWELTIIGNGPLLSEVESNDDVEYHSFIQPDELIKLLPHYGVFVLPSLYEAWGVVVHEAVAAGLPIISTTNCGAASTFVINGYNGMVCKPNDVNALKDCMRKLTQKNTDELSLMGGRSRELSKQISTKAWANQLFNLALQGDQ